MGVHWTSPFMVGERAENSSISAAVPEQLWQSLSLRISVKCSFMRESKLPLFGSFGQLYNFILMVFKVNIK